jgi:hypothetical protein
MIQQLTDEEWDDLVGLIAESPAERIGSALKRLGARHRTGRHIKEPLDPAFRHLTTEGWLLQLASISPKRGVRSGVAKGTPTT